MPWLGKSCGRYFQGIPVRLMYRIALSTSRKATSAGWPVGLRSSRALPQDLNVGSIRALRASDRLLGYGLRSLRAQPEHGHGERSCSGGNQEVVRDLETRRVSLAKGG